MKNNEEDKYIHNLISLNQLIAFSNYALDHLEEQDPLESLDDLNSRKLYYSFDKENNKLLTGLVDKVYSLSDSLCFQQTSPYNPKILGEPWDVITDAEELEKTYSQLESLFSWTKEKPKVILNLIKTISSDKSWAYFEEKYLGKKINYNRYKIHRSLFEYSFRTFIHYNPWMDLYNEFNFSVSEYQDPDITFGLLFKDMKDFDRTPISEGYNLTFSIKDYSNWEISYGDQSYQKFAASNLNPLEAISKGYDLIKEQEWYNSVRYTDEYQNLIDNDFKGLDWDDEFIDKLIDALKLLGIDIGSILRSILELPGVDIGRVYCGILPIINIFIEECFLFAQFILKDQKINSSKKFSEINASIQEIDYDQEEWSAYLDQFRNKISKQINSIYSPPYKNGNPPGAEEFDLVSEFIKHKTIDEFRQEAEDGLLSKPLWNVLSPYATGKINHISELDELAQAKIWSAALLDGYVLQQIRKKLNQRFPDKPLSLFQIFYLLYYVLEEMTEGWFTLERNIELIHIEPNSDWNIDTYKILRMLGIPENELHSLRQKFDAGNLNLDDVQINPSFWKVYGLQPNIDNYCILFYHINIKGCQVPLFLLKDDDLFKPFVQEHEILRT